MCKENVEQELGGGNSQACESRAASVRFPTACCRLLQVYQDEPELDCSLPASGTHRICNVVL